MSQAYKPLPLEEEQSIMSRDDASENEKWGWRSENKSRLHNQVQKFSTSHWTWIVQAVLLSASITFFAVTMCMRSSGKQTNSVPTTWCKSSSYKCI